MKSSDQIRKEIHEATAKQEREYKAAIAEAKRQNAEAGKPGSKYKKPEGPKPQAQSTNSLPSLPKKDKDTKEDPWITSRRTRAIRLNNKRIYKNNKDISPYEDDDD